MLVAELSWPSVRYVGPRTFEEDRVEIGARVVWWITVGEDVLSPS